MISNIWANKAERMLQILPDNLTDPLVIALLEEHLTDMRATSPPESVHALDIKGLLAPNMQFWAAWEIDPKGNELVGCVALKLLSSSSAELKSMRTSHRARGKGYGKQLLNFVLAYAETNKLNTVFLETGSQAFFAPARKLYANHGFQRCDPFGNYQMDPNSVFMVLKR